MKLFSGSLYIFLLLLGVWNFGHFSPQSKPYFVENSTSLQFIGVISDEPIVKEKTIRFPLRLEYGVDSMGRPNQVFGKVMMTLRRDSTCISIPQYGDKIQFLNTLRAIAPPYNPREFDYRTYLHNKGTYHQAYLNKEDFVVLAHEPTWFSYVLMARQYFVDKFRLYIEDDRSFGIASALVFGYRSGMDQEMLTAFTNTGTIHVLSVSGMHVSLVFLLFTFLLKPLDRIRHGRNARFGLVLVAIWLYVVLTGMAPPILRAGIMITFIIVAAWMGRHQVSLNTLLASAFFILIFSPHMLFDVGFQLSYLAMLGIFLIYPLLRNGYLPKNKILRPIVEYSYISIAAQLLTAPLAMYYFGQFPNYFLLANLIIALPATLIMYVGIALMIFPIDWLGKLLGTVEQFSVQCMFAVLKYIDQMPYATFQGLGFHPFQVLIMFLFIAGLFHAFNYRSKRMLYMAFVLVFIFVSSFYVHFYTSNRYQGVTIYSIRQHIAIAQINRGRATLYSTLDSIAHSTINYSVLPDLRQYCRPEHISFVKLSDSVNFQLNLANLSILIWNTGRMPEQQSDFVLIRKNRWVKETHNHVGKIYILDGSNSWNSLRNNLILMESEGMDYYVLKDNFAYVWEDK